MKYSATVTMFPIEWRVEFEQPAQGECVRVDLYRNGEKIDDHDVRWCETTPTCGGYLGNYSRSYMAGHALVGDPLHRLHDLLIEQMSAEPPVGYCIDSKRG